MVSGMHINRLLRQLVVYGCVISSGWFVASAQARDRGDTRPDRDAQVADDRGVAPEDRAGQRRSQPDRSVAQNIARPSPVDSFSRERSASRTSFLADADSERERERPSRGARPQTPRGGDAESGSDRSRPIQRNPEDAPQNIRRAPTDRPVPTDRPTVAPQPDAPVRQQPRPAERPDNNVTRGAAGERNQPRPVERPDNNVTRGATGDRNQPRPSDAPAAQPPVTRSGEDASRGVARPSTPNGEPIRRNPVVGIDGARRPDGSGDQPRTSSVARPDGVARTRSGEASAPIMRSRDDVARSIGRPATSNDRVRRSDGPGDIGKLPVASDRSQPVSRTREDASRSVGRPSPMTGDRVRAPVGEGRATRTDDLARPSREVGTRTTPDVGPRMGGTDRVRTTDRNGARGDPNSGRLGNGRVETARSADSVQARTVARGAVQGRGMEVRSNDRLSSRDVHVYNVGHHESRGGPEAFHGHDRDDRDFHHRGGWDGYRHDGWWHPHDDWHHDHHHVDVDFSFTFVSSYFAPAHAVVYDVVPVVPVYVAPAPVFSCSFAYYSAPAVVSVSSVRYVYPVAAVAPSVVVYHEYVAPAIITPVVFSPVVTTPVYAAPVVVPVVAPVCAPMYYYYPAYTVLSYPTYYVEPAPVVVAAPAVVETPSSGWSISGAFGFSHHGKEFSFGGSYTKVKSAPVVVAAPAVATPAVAVEAVPAGEAAPSEAAVDASGSATVEAAPSAQAEQTSLEAGLAAIRSGDMEQARRTLSQVVVNDPNDGLSRMLYTSALLADGQYKDAAEALRRALETWKDLQLKDYYLPSVYDNPKRFTQTMRDAREFLSDHPERVDAWLLVGWSYAFSGEAEQAQTLIAEAQKTWPDDPSFAALLRLVQAG